jgi:hypothetical protein
MSLKPRTFRPLAQVEDELKMAESLGFNVSVLINDTLRRHLWADVVNKMETVGERNKAIAASRLVSKAIQ